MQHLVKWLFIFILVVPVMVACAPIKSNRWYDSQLGKAGLTFFERVLRQKPQVSGNSVIVRKGDNYYRIAERHKVSLRALIEVNKARPPYLLNPGDRVQLPRPRFYKVRRNDTLYAISRRYGVDMSALARANDLRPPYTITVGQKLKLPYAGRASTRVAQSRPSSPSSSPSSSSSLPQASSAPKTATTPAPRRAGRFLRPVDGKIISDFGSKEGGLHNDGINIVAPLGTPVKATENGVVVYAGNELRGYGNLLLVRHSDGWVSAYAHTARFRVQQGQRVKQGQIIADVGQTGNVERPQLHFELRKGTRAVNPKSLI